MESLWKQASKLKEQVSKQPQAVLKQYSGAGFGGSDTVNTDDVELKQHQKLEKLYVSIRAAKHLQRDIVRGVESYVVAGSKQVEIGNKLSDDSRRYGVENTCKSDSSLSKAASSFGRSWAQVEKDRRILLKSLEMQVAEPLRAMVVGAPLQDVRHLAQRYNRMRQETQAQTIEVSKRQAKVRESAGSAENVLKLEAAQAKLQELKSNTIALGREATAAMAAVEVQQQRSTLQQLISMVEAERNFHRRVLQILDQLKGEMSEHQGLKASTSAVENTMPSPPSYDDVNAAENTMPPPPSYDEVNGVFASQMCDGSTDGVEYFLGEAMYTFQAVSDVELTLSIGDYVVVRKLSNNGWAEGECKGKAGWFPFVYIERRERVLASKIA